MGLTQKLGTIPLAVFTDSSNNVGIGGAANASFKLQVTGTTNVTGVLTLGSTISNGTFTYTLPSATGTLALTSNLSDYVPYSGATGAVNLGANGLTANALAATNGNNGVLTLGSATYFTTIQHDATTTGATIYTTAAASGGGHIFKIGTTTPLTIASGGAATFSSSIAATSATFSGVITSTQGNNGTLLQGTSATTGWVHMIRATNTGQDVTMFIENSTGGDRAIGTLPYAAGLCTYTNTALQFGTNNNIRLTIGGTGAATFSSILGVNGAAPSTPFTTNFWVNGSGGAFVVRNNGQEAYLVNTSAGYFGTTAAGSTLYLTSGAGTNTMVLNGSGNVGIGTSSPANKLTISNNGNAAIAFRINDTNANASFLSLNVSDSDAAIIAGGTSGIPFDIYTGGSIRMRITSGGDVLINQTTLSAASLSTPHLQFKNEIITTGTNAGIFWENRSGGVTSTTNWYGFYTLGGVIYLYNGNANIASISSSTGVYTPLSDVNKKKDFEQSTIGLDAVLGLKPTLYRMKSDDTDGNKELGFIAQEVKDFIPQAYAESGDFIGLNYNAIVAALVKSVQEQQAQIEELRQIVATK